MMRATDAPAAMKPIATENLSRLLLNLKRFSYSNFFKKKKTSNAFRNYLAIAFKKFKLFFKVKTLQEKYQSHVIFEQSKARMRHSIFMNNMFRENDNIVKNEDLTMKLNEYKKQNLLTKKEKRDLNAMTKEFFGDNIETDIDIKSNLISRVERRQALKNKVKTYKEKSNINIENDFSYKKFDDTNFDFILNNKSNNYEKKTVNNFINKSMKKSNDKFDSNLEKRQKKNTPTGLPNNPSIEEIEKYQFEQIQMLTQISKQLNEEKEKTKEKKFEKYSKWDKTINKDLDKEFGNTD